MSKLSQKDAVYNITCSVLDENNIHLEDGQSINEVMTKDMRQSITLCLIAGFNSGEVQIDKDYEEKELRSYTQSVISNWFRKDARLNGGSKYEPKDKGSKVGFNDPQVKAMRRMLKEVKKTGNIKHIKAIESEIDKKLREIRDKRLKDKVDAQAIPEHLRHLL